MEITKTQMIELIDDEIVKARYNRHSSPDGLRIRFQNRLDVLTAIRALLSLSYTPEQVKALVDAARGIDSVTMAMDNGLAGTLELCDAVEDLQSSLKPFKGL
jgi:hypothetical protein